MSKHVTNARFCYYYYLAANFFLSLLSTTTPQAIAEVVFKGHLQTVAAKNDQVDCERQEDTNCSLSTVHKYTIKLNENATLAV